MIIHHTLLVHNQVYRSVNLAHRSVIPLLHQIAQGLIYLIICESHALQSTDIRLIESLESICLHIFISLAVNSCKIEDDLYNYTNFY